MLTGGASSTSPVVTGFFSSAVAIWRRRLWRNNAQQDDRSGAGHRKHSCARTYLMVPGAEEAEMMQAGRRELKGLTAERYWYRYPYRP